MRDPGEFIKRLKQRDGEAFKELYTDTSHMVFGYILVRVSGKREIAEDILSEVYCDAMVYSVSLTFTHNLNAWLLRIARSKIGDYYRKIKKERRLVAAESSLVKEKSLLNDLSNQPEAEAIAKEHGELLSAAFLRLKEEDQRVLKEKYMDGKSICEIAAACGKTEKAVENILYRAKKAFNHELGKITREKIYFFTLILVFERHFALLIKEIPR